MHKISFITKVSQDKLTKSFITLDIECWVNPATGEHNPYAIGIYDGLQFYYCWSPDCSNKLLDFLLKKAFANSTIIYVHNLNYDGPLLLALLIKYEQVRCGISIIKNNTHLLEIKVVLENKRIYIRDSFRFLLNSLKNVGELFGVEIRKLYFPHSFVDSKNKLKYVGAIPSINYFNGITKEEYDNLCFKGNTFNLKEELIDYLNNDCILLFQVMTSFTQHIFNKEKIDVGKSITLPSLAFKIFRANYLKQDNIARLTPNMDRFIRRSFFGGNSEVFKPYYKGKLYHFDVNSLYPYVMYQNDMPLGLPKVVIADKSTKIVDTFFGFIECEVETPNFLYYPVLPIEKDNGLIFPLGRFSGVWFSEELKYAQSLGYKIIKVKMAFSFERGNIFKDYVSEYYKIKETHPKFHPLRTIAKLMLNSLYGKFGQRADFIKTELVDGSTFLHINQNFKVANRMEMPHSQYYVEWINPQQSKAAIKNVAISSAIASYARIFMHQLISNNQEHIFYTDTDSIISKSPDLKGIKIGKNIGELKLEREADEGFFLAPKMYALFKEGYPPHTVMKGIPSDAVFPDDFNVLFKGSSITYPMPIFSKSILSIHSKDIFKTITIFSSNKRLKVFKDQLWVDSSPIKIPQ